MPPTEHLALVLLRKGGVALLAAAAAGWWAVHVDAVTRAERSDYERVFREERAEDRKQWTRGLREISEACLRGHAVREPAADE